MISIILLRKKNPPKTEKPAVTPKKVISAPAPEPTLRSNLFSPDTAVNEDLQHDVLYKVIIIGDSGVGKTQFYNRWLYDRTEETKATINIGFGAKSYKLDNLVVKVQLWDTAGQERYRALARQYYRGAQGVILMYTIADESSFENMQRWIEEVQDFTTEDCRLILIGNKSDLADQRQVSTEEAIRLAKSKNIHFLETSAEQGHNCVKAIQLILQEIHEMQQTEVQAKKTKSEEPPLPSLTSSIPLKPDTKVITLQPQPEPKNPVNPTTKPGCCG